MCCRSIRSPVIPLLLCEGCETPERRGRRCPAPEGRIKRWHRARTCREERSVQQCRGGGRCYGSRSGGGAAVGGCWGWAWAEVWGELSLAGAAVCGQGLLLFYLLAAGGTWPQPAPRSLLLTGGEGKRIFLQVLRGGTLRVFLSSFSSRDFSNFP